MLIFCELSFVSDALFVLNVTGNGEVLGRDELLVFKFFVGVDRKAPRSGGAKNNKKTYFIKLLNYYYKTIKSVLNI